MKDYAISNLTGDMYYLSDVVRIINTKQATLYCKHGAKLLDLYTSIDAKTGNPILVFIYNRKDTQDLYDAWCKHELR